MSTAPRVFPPYEYENYKSPTWWNRNFWIIITIVVGFLIINSIFLSKAFRGTDIDPEKANQLGSFVGGYIGSLFGLVSFVILVLTLRDQRESSNLEKFENKYFELIRLHRDNVMELGIGRDMGKKTFISLIREFRMALPIVKEAAAAVSLTLSPEQIFVIGYLILFYGIGINSTRILKKALKEHGEAYVDKLVTLIEQKREKVKSEGKLFYTIFEGHQSRLGHYYRHLYQTITYVDQKNDIKINKYSYVKTLRAQLTNHEQALLFINSLSPLGKPWWNKELIVRYQLVKNLPESFFDETKEIDLRTFFPTDYFEWQKSGSTSNPLSPAINP
jgi:Putative phage abortive infection protein